jgi:hypothetical protein
LLVQFLVKAIAEGNLVVTEPIRNGAAVVHHSWFRLDLTHRYDRLPLARYCTGGENSDELCSADRIPQLKCLRSFYDLEVSAYPKADRLGEAALTLTHRTDGSKSQINGTQ